MSVSVSKPKIPTVKSTGVRSVSDSRAGRKPAPALPKYAAGAVPAKATTLAMMADQVSSLRSDAADDDYRYDTNEVARGLAATRQELQRNYDQARLGAAVDAMGSGVAWSPAMLGRMQGTMRSDYRFGQGQAAEDAAVRQAALYRAWMREKQMLEAEAAQRALTTALSVPNTIRGL